MTVQHAKTQRWSKTWADRQRRISAPREAADDFVAAYPPHPGRRMSEQEFVEWVDERTRAEWVNGDVIIMSPVNYDHDQLQSWLMRVIADFVDEHDLGRICGSEFWLRLPNATSLRLTDLYFVARGREAGFQRVSRVKEGPATCFNGPPDLVVEIVSPDSVERDHKQKLKEYQEAGVREYWIVDPMTQSVQAHELARSKYRLIPEKDGAVHSRVLKGFWLRPAWLWQAPLPKKSAVLREIGIT